jgi:hypothetical protein
MERQGIHAFLPLDGINADHRRLAGKFDSCNDRVQLGRVEIALELLARLPIFDQQQSLSSVEIRIETGIQAARGNPRWSKYRSKSAQQCWSLFVGGHDLDREDDQDSRLSSSYAKRGNRLLASHRKKRANAERAARLERNLRWISGVTKSSRNSCAAGTIKFSENSEHLRNFGG